MDKNHPIVEPNFEGEEMKLPTVTAARSVAPTPAGGVLSLPIIILLFLLLVAILGGFYYWYTIVMNEAIELQNPTEPIVEDNNKPKNSETEVRTEPVGGVSQSDELEAISADIDNINLNDLESEVPAIESELNAALAVPPPTN